MLKIRAGTSKMLVKKSPLTCIRQTNKSISIIKKAWSKVKVVSRRISYSPRLHSKCSSQQTSQDFHTATYGYRFITIKQDFHTPHITGMCIKRGIQFNYALYPGSLFMLFPNAQITFSQSSPLYESFMLLNKYQIRSIGVKWPEALWNHKPPFPTSTLSRISFGCSDKHLNNKQKVKHRLLR